VEKTAPTTNLNRTCELQLRERKKNSCEGSFDAIMIEAVDEIFSSFGHSCKQALYFQLENTFKIKKQEIPLKIEDFANAIEQIFGIGAKFIEMKIIEMLHKKTQGFMYFPKKEDLVFTEYAASLRSFFVIANLEFNQRLPLQRKRTLSRLLQNNPHFLFPQLLPVTDHNLKSHRVKIREKINLIRSTENA
jgi:hypothetical protein